MNRFGAVATVVLMVAAMASAVMSAGTGSIEIGSPVNVAGTTLQPGRYVVEWKAEGDAAKVVIKSGKQEVSATGKLVELQAKPSASSIVRNSNDNTLAEMRFRGKTTAITFEQR